MDLDAVEKYLPVQLELEMQHKSESLSPEMGMEPEWDADTILQHAEAMATLKERMFDKAKSNIDRAQEKDKEYYDKKHSDPRVWG